MEGTENKVEEQATENKNVQNNTEIKEEAKFTQTDFEDALKKL